MSKLFRYSESLGKSAGNKWSQIRKLLLIKGVKLPGKKKVFFFGEFCLTKLDFFGIGATSMRDFLYWFLDFY